MMIPQMESPYTISVSEVILAARYNSQQLIKYGIWLQICLAVVAT